MKFDSLKAEASPDSEDPENDIDLRYKPLKSHMNFQIVCLHCSVTAYCEENEGPLLDSVPAAASIGPPYLNRQASNTPLKTGFKHAPYLLKQASKTLWSPLRRRLSSKFRHIDHPSEKTLIKNFGGRKKNLGVEKKFGGQKKS